MSLNRNRNILDYALHILWRNRLKNGGVLFVFILVIFILASFRLVTSGLERSAEMLLETVPDVTVQKIVAGRQVNLKETELVFLKEIFGIKEFKKRVWGYYFDEMNGANYTVIGIEHLNEPELIPETVLGTVGADTGSRKGADVIVGDGFVRSRQLQGRGSFSLFRPDLSMASFHIVGLFSQETALVTDDLLVMQIESARDLFGIPEDEMTDLLITVGNPNEIDTVAKKISDGMEGSRVITRNQIRKTYRAAFGWRSGFGLVCLLGSVAAFTILAWDKALGLSPEQRREVGILRVLGWQATDIMSLKMWESATVALLGFCIGYTLAWAHVVWLNGALFAPLLFGWSVLQPSIEMTPDFRFSDLLLIFALSVVPYFGATLVPIWRNSMIRPDSVI